MKKAKTKVKRSESTSTRLLILEAIVFSVHFFIVMAAVLIFFIVDASVFDNYPIVLFTLFSAGFISAFISVSKLKKKGLVFGLLINLPVNIVYVLASLILNGFTIDIRLVITSAVLISASAIGGVTAVNRARARRIR